MTGVYETGSPRETGEIAKKLGEEVTPGTVIVLLGDLGVGKTVFAQGVAEGLGIRDVVSSPTFTILQTYEDGRLPLYHYDVYRLGDADEMEEIGYREAFYGGGVCLIEWAERIAELLPEHYLRVEIRKDPEKGMDYRRVEILER